MLTFCVCVKLRFFPYRCLLQRDRGRKGAIQVVGQQLSPMGDARKGTHLMKSPLGSVRRPKPTGQ